MSSPEGQVSLLEKADTVLWAFNGQGIVLHNFARGVFAELNEQQHSAWRLFDGVHTFDDIVDTVATAHRADIKHARNVVLDLMAELVSGGFLMERGS